MNIDQDLIGKTITGVVASAPEPGGPREIWLLQFSDGTHVEFVSPGSRRALRRSSRPARPVTAAAAGTGQLKLNVA